MKSNLKIALCAIAIAYCYYQITIDSKYQNILIFIIIAASFFGGVCYAKRERQTMEVAPPGAPSLPSQVPLSQAPSGLPKTPPQNYPEEFEFEQQRTQPPGLEEQRRFDEK